MAKEIKDAERYLDSSRVIRELEAAEENHQLDAQGVLDELARACATCDRHGAYHQEQANAYMLARAAYFAEAQRRTALSPVEAGLRRRARELGLPDPTAKEGFKNFCERIGVGHSMAKSLAQIGSSPDPLRKLNERRAYFRAANRKFNGTAEVWQDPLTAAKKIWRKLSPAQRLAFLDWVYSMSADAPINVAARQEEMRVSP